MRNMRFSLRFLVSVISGGLGLIVGIVLVLVASYLFYQNAIREIIEERSAELKAIKNTLYSENFYYRGVVLGSPEIKRTFIREIATVPWVVFLRIIQPNTGKVLVSNNEKEIGQIFENLPPFPLEPFVRQGIWNGEKILEFSIQGIATENLWLGVSLKAAPEAAFKIAFQTGIMVLIFIISIGIILYFTFQKIIFDPLMAIFQGVEKVKKGNLEVEVPIGSKTEIGELAATFNEMIKELKNSRESLEEAKTVLEIKVQARTKELRELAESLDEKVKERTKDLQEKIEELERFQRLTVGRELRMIELKEEIKKLKKELEKYGHKGE